MQLGQALYDKFGGELDFGECLSNNAIKFLEVIDLDNTICKVPFISYSQSLQQFRIYYLSTTHCQGMIPKNKEISLELENIPFVAEFFHQYTISDLSETQEQKPRVILQSEKHTKHQDQQHQPHLNQIDVLVLNIQNKDRVRLKASPDDQVYKLKLKYEQYTGIPNQVFRLFYNESILNDKQTLKYYNIRKGTLVFAIQSQEEIHQQSKKEQESIISENLSQIGIGNIDKILSIKVTKNRLESINSVQNQTFFRSVPNPFQNGHPLQHQHQPIKVISGFSLQSYYQISQKPQKIQKKQPLYCITVQNNHNFIAEGLIAHSLYLSISHSHQTIRVDPQQSIQQLLHSQQLNPDKRMIILEDKYLSDIRLQNHNPYLKQQSDLHLMTRLRGGHFAASTKILVSHQQYLPIEQIKIGMKIISFNSQSGEKQEDEVISINQKTIADTIYIVELQDGSTLQFSGPVAFLLVEQSWKSVKHPDEFLRLQQGDCLLTDQGRFMNIKYLTPKRKQEEEIFYSLCVRKNNSFSANGLIIRNVFVYAMAEHESPMVVDVPFRQDIQSLIKNVSSKKQIKPQALTILFEGQQLGPNSPSSYYASKSMGHDLVSRIKGACFEGSTNVMVSQFQYLSIEQLRVGMPIVSYNVKYKRLEMDVITSIFPVWVDEAIKVEIKDGKRYLQLVCAPYNRFMAENHQWINVRDLWCPTNIIKAIKKINYQDLVMAHYPQYKLHKSFIRGAFVRRDLRLTIKQSGKVFMECEWQSEYNISLLKLRIELAKGIAIGAQKLYYDGTQLQAQQTLSAYSHKKFIELELKLQGNLKVQVKIINAKQKDLRIQITCHNMIVEKIKRLIEDSLNIKYQNLVLISKDRILEDKHYLSDYNIHQTKQIEVIHLQQKLKIKDEGGSFEVSINKKLPILFLRKQVAKHKKTKLETVKLNEKQRQLEDQELICKLQFPELIQFKKTQLQSRMKRIFNAFVFFQVDGDQSNLIEYMEIRELTVKMALRKVIRNPQPYYCLMFDNILFQPEQPLRKLLQFQISVTETPYIVLKVLKNSQKLIFHKHINLNVTVPKQNFALDSASQKQISTSISVIQQKAQAKYKNEKFYTPIHYYTCNKFYKPINETLRNIRFLSLQVFQSYYMQFIGALINSLLILPNFIGETHRGLANIRFSTFQKEGDIFYWRSFTSTSTKAQVAQNFKNKVTGTIFHIKSLTGKDLQLFSVYPHEKQILFLPFTYFLVQKCVIHEKYDEVWLSQMPTPNTFSKNFIVWVDDNPTNNTKYIKQFQQNKIEVLQLTSTLMAKRWTNQYTWLLNWIDVKFKVISDMVRVQKQKNNYEAGIDLLEHFYNIKNYSTPILIFCGNEEKAKQNAKKRKIQKANVYRISNNYQELQKYVKFD